MAKAKKFLIIDANSLIHRAYHALPPLTTKDGRLVNAVYGFANIFLKALRDIKPEFVAVCFDMPGGTFRDEIFEGYKAGREEKPQEFYDQFDIIKDFLKAYKAQVYELEGYEADDLIGTLARQGIKAKEAIKNVVLTGDKDMLQLVDKFTEVEVVKKGVSETVTFTPTMVRNVYGFSVEQLVDYKALRGDPSDNIPGVAGIGEKTGTDLIQEFGTLDNIYAEVKKCQSQPDKCKLKDSVLKKLKGHKQDAIMSKKLVIINRSAPIKFKLADVELKDFDRDEVIAFIQALGFKSLLNRLPKVETPSLFATDDKQQTTTKDVKDRKRPRRDVGGASRKSSVNYFLVDTEGGFKKFLSELKKQKVFALDTETDSLDVVSAVLVGLSFSWKVGHGYYLPASLKGTKLYSQLIKILEDQKIKKVGHNIKYDYQILKQAGINLQGIEFDSMIASYLLNPGSRSHSLSALAFQEFGHQMIPIEDLIGKKGKDQKTMADIPPEQIAEYAAEDADFTWRLYKLLSKDKNLRHVTKVLHNIEMPLLTILGDMELRGIKVDTVFLNKFSQKLAARIKKLEVKIFKLAGTKFNVGSPIQLKEVLFTKLKISTDGLSRTKTGISTSVHDLEKLKGRHKIIEHIMEFRELAKLKNTYTDALPELVNEQTGRVHTDFNQTVAATGRLSSSNPNLQNIPIRTELGREIRKAFVADKGWQLVSVDYSQFELRIAASLSNDKRMLQAFRKGEDIHRQTAAEVYDIPLDEVTSQQRREAKEVNFGIIYGLGPRGMSLRAQIPYERAKKFYDKYFELHPQLKDYLESIKDTTRSLGFAETLFGRRRYFPEIQAEHPALRAAAERAAVNLPIQGSQADLIKIAMIELAAEIKKKKLDDDIRMLLQVHDELVFEIKKPLVAKATKMIKTAMESVYKLKVPIKVHVGVGKNWAEAK